jgi:uncharacterized protein
MRSILSIIFTCCLFAVSFAQDNCIPEKPSPARFVNNLSKEFPNFLSSGEEQSLENKLQQFNKETSNQIVILIVDDLCGFDANEFSTRVGQKWGVGQAKFDNGVVVMIKPTGGAGQRDAYIAVGYGLEGAVPDITAKHIVDNEIIPWFKNGNYYQALDDATGVLISLAKNEYSYADYQKSYSKNWTPFIIFLVIFIFYVILTFRRKAYTLTRSGRTYYGGGWGGGFSGGGGFGGGGGGGSFGGGGFGGGGAGGKW